jgi:hypothetical protein
MSTTRTKICGRNGFARDCMLQEVAERTSNILITQNRTRIDGIFPLHPHSDSRVGGSDNYAVNGIAIIESKEQHELFAHKYYLR